MPTMRLQPDPTVRAYSAPPDPLAGKGGGAPGKERGRNRKGGRGGGKGKIVATRYQILRLKCEDALYKCTDFILTYLLTYLHVHQ